MDILKAFVVNQAAAVVLALEAFDFSTFMLERPTVNAVGHANVERAGTAGHDVHEVLMLFH